jgi:ABC-type lipoprotein release transport system permease subunit
VLAGGLVRSLLYEVGPGDPLTFALVGSFALASCSLAAWIPARRAARIDPRSAIERG